MISVAGYCRVSTDREDQANSFEAQQRYFAEYISHHPDWELFDIYADEGISGTGTKNRHQFNRMLYDAHSGKFSLILTKEVSRFSRNILDTVAFTRELKALGIGVRFLLDGIDTMNPDAELHLSIMGSLAQEESRKTSCRVCWGQARQMERGVVFGHSLLGYDVRSGKLYMEPEGAETVRQIFRQYALESRSAYQIARYLTETNRKTYRGNTRWTSQSVLKILRNEKYVGDLVQRKTYTPDFLTHEKRANKGNIPLISIPDHHEPIISRQLWNLAQMRLSRNPIPRKTSIPSGVHAFSGKIYCGICGKAYVARYKYRKNGTKLRRWSCSTAVSEGAAGCKIGKLVREDDALQMLHQAITSLSFDREELVKQTVDLMQSALRKESRIRQSESERLQTQLQKTKHKKEALIDSFLDNLITKEDMQTMCKKYEAQINTIQKQLSRTDKSADAKQLPLSPTHDIKQILFSLLSGRIPSNSFYRELLQNITVFPDRHMELRLRNLNTVFYFSEGSSSGFFVEKPENL